MVSQWLRRLAWQVFLVIGLILVFAGPAAAQEDNPGYSDFTWPCASVAVILGFLVLVLSLGASRKRSRKRRSRSRTRRTTITSEPDYYGPADYRSGTTRRRRAPRRRSRRYRD